MKENKISNLDYVCAYEYYTTPLIEKILWTMCFPFGTFAFWTDYFKYKKEFWRFNNGGWKVNERRI